MLDSTGDGALSRRRLSNSSFAVANPLARLYAMGIDAYRLTPRLPLLAKSPGAFYPGQTGGLSVDGLGRIQRQLALGQFTETGVSEAGAEAQGGDAPASRSSP
jgi:outer membrane PBP1 activator LpoA protein